jgi:hypothetical protein
MGDKKTFDTFNQEKQNLVCTSYSILKTWVPYDLNLKVIEILTHEKKQNPLTKIQKQNTHSTPSIQIKIVVLYYLLSYERIFKTRPPVNYIFYI